MQRLSALFLTFILMLWIPFIGIKAQQNKPSTQVTKNSGVARLNVRGTVFENQTLEPLQGATVKLFNDKDSMITGAITAETGRFLLPNIRAEKRKLQGERHHDARRSNADERNRYRRKNGRADGGR